MELSKMFTFEAGHRLINKNLSNEENNKIYGKCFGSGLNDEICHGHSYKLQVVLSGEKDNNGMIVNFHDFKDMVYNFIIRYVDHKFLNEVDFLKEEPTTCENMINKFWDILDGYLINHKSNIFLKRLQLWETDDNSSIREISDTDRAWLAALIDGKGTITINQFYGNRRGKNRRFRYYGRISIANTNMILMNEINNRFPCFKITKKSEIRKLNCKSGYSARVLSKPDMKRILLYTYPYLIIKKEQAEILKDFCNKSDVSSDEAKLLYEKIHILNQRGFKELEDINNCEVSDEEKKNDVMTEEDYMSWLS